MRPKLSVLLPLKNAAATLEDCLKSLESQTFSSFEIIAVDHASDDASSQILKTFAARDTRLRVIQSDAPSLPLALNEGLAACEGEFVARMDADDLCMPTRFENQVKMLKSDQSLAMLGCKVEFFSESNISDGMRAYETWINSLDSPDAIQRGLFVECPLPHPSWMARRELFESLKYLDDGLPEDYHFVLRAVEMGVRMAKPEGVLLRWREHDTRHSKTHARYARPAFMKLRARFLKRLVIKDDPCILWGAGDRGRLLARLLQDEGVAISSVVGWSPKGTEASSVHGVEVIPPEALPATLPGPLIACVGAPGARDEIRAWAGKRRWTEGKDYWFAS